MQVKVSGVRADSAGPVASDDHGLGERDTGRALARCGSFASLANNGFTAAQHKGDVKIMCLAYSENSKNISKGSKLLMF